MKGSAYVSEQRQQIGELCAATIQPRNIFSSICLLFRGKTTLILVATIYAIGKFHLKFQICGFR